MCLQQSDEKDSKISQTIREILQEDKGLPELNNINILSIVSPRSEGNSSENINMEENILLEDDMTEISSDAFGGLFFYFKSETAHITA